MKKYVVCPPCGTIFEAETEDELVRVTQTHSTEKHSYTPPRDEVLGAMTSTPPDSADGE
jgi:predicted small metal-binding protein